MALTRQAASITDKNSTTMNKKTGFYKKNKSSNSPIPSSPESSVMAYMGKI